MILQLLHHTFSGLMFLDYPGNFDINRYECDEAERIVR